MATYKWSCAMAFEENDQAAGLQTLQELTELRADPPSPRHASQAKGPAPQAFLPDGNEEPGRLVREAEGGGGKHSGDRPRRRHRFAVPVAMVLAASVAAGGYLYWDNARRFETTDDAFIAARQ